MRHSTALILAGIVLLSCVGLGHADWPADPEVNLPIATGPANQGYWGVSIVTDGSSGAIVAWDDDRNGDEDIYSQRIDANGNIMWAAGGKPVCTATGIQRTLVASDDGMGGAVVAWIDMRNGNQDVYAQRIDANGNVLWPASAPSLEAVAVCTSAGIQEEITVISDGAGGAYIAWTDKRDYPSLPPKVYAQYLDANGDAAWASDGKLIATSAGTQGLPDSTTDGAGGVIVVWRDGRNSLVTNFDIWAQRMSANGTRLWSDDGALVCAAGAGQTTPRVDSDGFGGAVIAWEDRRNTGGTNADIYAQRLNSNGTTRWLANGVEVCVELYTQYRVDIASDGAGGAMVVWEDSRDQTTNTDIFGQLLNSDGVGRWTEYGESLGVADNLQTFPKVVRSGNLTFVAVWQDGHNPSDYDVYTRRMTASGPETGSPRGEPVSTAANWQSGPEIAANGLGGGIVAWSDWRDSTASASDVYISGTYVDGLIFVDGFEVGLVPWSGTSP